MKYLIILLSVLFSSIGMSSTLPYEGNFWNHNSQMNFEGDEFKVDINNSAGHLGDFGSNVLSVYNLNPYIFYPNFEVGFIDDNVGNHDDFHNFHGFIDWNGNIIDNHANGVFSLLSGSKVSNNMGTHGILNTFTYYTSLKNYRDVTESYNEPYDELFLVGTKLKVISQSVTLNFCTSYSAFEQKDICWQGGENYTEAEAKNHIIASQALRNYFSQYPNVLFVLSAGNDEQDASWNNGAIHYSYDFDSDTIIFDPLDNSIIVAANGYDNELHYYSNYGESVDIATISGLLAARCVDEKGSHYYTDNTEDGYGIYRASSDNSNSGAPCDSTGYGNGNNAFNGTSAATPVIAGLGSLLFSLDSSISPKEVKNKLIGSNKKAFQRYTDEKIDEIFELESLTTFQRYSYYAPNSDRSIPIVDFKVSYDSLISDLEIEVNSDISSLVNLTREINHDSDCILLWNDGTSTRKAIGPKKSYEAKFYGDRCLYFRGNSFIIDYDLETKTASKLYYDTVSNSKYREYMTFRHFVNNLKSAKADETWRNGYGVTLNSSGNIGCTVADNCTNGEINSTKHCKNTFSSLTGVSFNLLNLRDIITTSTSCYYQGYKITKRLEYNFITGQLKISDFSGYHYQDMIFYVLSVYNNLINSYEKCFSIVDSAGISLNNSDLLLTYSNYACHLEIISQKVKLIFYTYDLGENMYHGSVDIKFF